MSNGNYYQEKYRPQFHFTAKKNWLNDPCGCVYHKGIYHLFFQHNPEGLEHGNMSWGHAVSKDLIHWEQLENALLPFGGGTIYTGTVVVDTDNRSQLGRNGDAPLVALFTHTTAPYAQCLAYSNDDGMSWKYFNQGNPVLPNQGLDDEERDPKVFWHEPSARWVMVLSVREGQARFFTSENLIQWTPSSDFFGERFFECPDCFELPIDGDVNNKKWIIHDAHLRYWLGSFDGLKFEAESGPVRADLGKNFYASQTWNHTQDRLVHIGWMRNGVYPEMPFTQQMSFPCELSLRTTPQGIRLCREPVKKIASLYRESETLKNHTLKTGDVYCSHLEGELFDVSLEVKATEQTSFTLNICGQEIIYAQGKFKSLDREAELAPCDGMVRLRILVDRTSLEFFGNNGDVSLSQCYLQAKGNQSVKLATNNPMLQINHFTIHRLGSSWGHFY